MNYRGYTILRSQPAQPTRFFMFAVKSARQAAHSRQAGGGFPTRWLYPLVVCPFPRKRDVAHQAWGVSGDTFREFAVEVACETAWVISSPL
jgi:hypothetical protein